MGVLAGEEELGSDQGADERRNTVPGLAELQTCRGKGWVTDDDSVRVGSCLESCKTTGNDQGAGAEATEGSNAVLIGGEVGSGPEEDGTQGIEREAHEDSDLVALALHDFSSNGREEQVTTTEVDDLQTGRLELGDVEDGLEMLVEHIEKTVGETPEEEERDDEGEREDELSAL